MLTVLFFGRIFQLIQRYIRPGLNSLCFVFPKVMWKLKSVVSPWPAELGSFLCMLTSCLPELTFTATFGVTHREQVVRNCVFGWDTQSTWGYPHVSHFQQFLGGLLEGVISAPCRTSRSTSESASAAKLLTPYKLIFALMVCWNLSSGNLDFHRGCPNHVLSSKTYFPGAPTQWPRQTRAGYGPLRVHIWD